MLRVFCFDGEGGPTEVEDANRISDLLQNGTAVWADIVDPAPGEIDQIELEFGLHPLAIEDVAKHGQRPKIEIFDDHAFLVAYASCECNGTYELVEVDIFLGHNWMLTIHDRSTGGAHFDGEAVRERFERTKKRKVTGAILLYVVLDEIVDTYFEAVESLGDEVDELEDQIFEASDPERGEMGIQRSMLQLRRDLLGFRRRVVPLRDVLVQLLRDDVEWVSQEAHHYYQDVLDHVLRVADEIDSNRELIGNAVDAHLALVSNHMNQTMKKMTSWGAILICATLVAGIYGMNFEYMPELHLRYGYFAALGAMALITIGLYSYFRHKDWL